MGWLKDRRERKRQLLRQVDIIEQQYNELISDYARLRSDFEKLRLRRIELKKQVENLKGL